MIDVSVLNVKPHPDQATNNPGTWAVKFRVAHDGRSRTFWRWHTIREQTRRKPEPDEILARFWDDTFAGLHGFDFERDEATP
jgi:hypothetical protein